MVCSALNQMPTFTAYPQFVCIMTLIHIYYAHASTARGHNVLIANSHRLSAHLSVPCLTLSQEQKGRWAKIWQEGSPWHRWPVTTFRGWKATGHGRGNKVTGKNSFSFEARPTAAGVWSDTNSWWRHLTNRFTNIGIKCQKLNEYILVHMYFPPKFKDLK